MIDDISYVIFDNLDITFNYLRINYKYVHVYVIEYRIFYSILCSVLWLNNRHFVFQTRSPDEVVIMELCEGGSLQHVLDQPENYYGLPEEEFMLVFEHISKFM